MLGNLHLRLPEDVLKVANAKRALREEIQDPQTGDVAQAFVDANKLHAAKRARDGTCRKRNMVCHVFRPESGRVGGHCPRCAKRETPPPRGMLVSQRRTVTFGFHVEAPTELIAHFEVITPDCGGAS